MWKRTCEMYNSIFEALISLDYMMDHKLNLTTRYNLMTAMNL